MNSAQKARFSKVVKDYYQRHGRHDLPWRKTTDPYKIIVSEVMLQQTQVARVIQKYTEFLKAFPNAKSLAEAPLQQILLLWSGLGYNRRARFLQQMAQAVTSNRNGKFPKTFDELVQLPGIGHYTAGAVMAFSYNQPLVFIETNIRTVYLHYFFATTKEIIHDRQLLPLIEATLDHSNSREWYWALMDYGSHLKSIGVKIHRNSAQYNKQSTFKGSLRQVRGGIIKVLTTDVLSLTALEQKIPFEKDRIEEALTTLLKEGLVIKKGKQYSIS